MIDFIHKSPRPISRPDFQASDWVTDFNNIQPRFILHHFNGSLYLSRCILVKHMIIVLYY